MPPPIVLASTSAVRAQLLRNAGLDFAAIPARIDEQAFRAALAADTVSPRDQADALAEGKASKISRRHPEAVVIGCDQILELKGAVLSKPSNIRAARDQLLALRGQTHMLHSAAVVYENGTPVWRHVGTARLTMRAFSDAYLDAYLGRLGTQACTTVGSYRLEGEGIRLFDRIQGDYFTILGLPLLELLGYLSVRGMIES